MQKETFGLMWNSVKSKKQQFLSLSLLPRVKGLDAAQSFQLRPCLRHLSSPQNKRFFPHIIDLLLGSPPLLSPACLALLAPGGSYLVPASLSSSNPRRCKVRACVRACGRNEGEQKLKLNLFRFAVNVTLPSPSLPKLCC